MDKKEQTSPVPENGNWLDEILGTSDSVRELGPDELAIQAAGLTHPKDAQLEQILAEDWDSVPDLPQQEACTPAEPSAPEQSAAGASTEAAWIFSMMANISPLGIGASHLTETMVSGRLLTLTMEVRLRTGFRISAIACFSPRGQVCPVTVIVSP